MTKGLRGRFFEDFTVGDVYRTPLGRTVTETDNIWFTSLTMNTNQMHFNREWASRTRIRDAAGQFHVHVGSCPRFSVRDTSENAAANLGWADIKLPQARFRRRHTLGRDEGDGRARVE